MELPFGFAAVSVGCDPSPSVTQCFSRAELSAAASQRLARLVVYRGQQEHLPGLRWLGSYVELGVVFAEVTAESYDLSMGALLDLLANVAQPGKRVFAHGGAINRRVVAHCVGPHLGRYPRDLSPDYRTTYEQLAAACAGHAGSYAIGLRGRAAASRQLKVMTLNGLDPRIPEHQEAYPLQSPVQLYAYESLPEDDSSIASALRAICDRVNEDGAWMVEPARTHGRTAYEVRAAVAN